MISDEQNIAELWMQNKPGLSNTQRRRNRYMIRGTAKQSIIHPKRLRA